MSETTPRPDRERRDQAPRRRRPRGKPRRSGQPTDRPGDQKRNPGRPRQGYRPPSPEVIAQREAALPPISYPAQLPVSARAEDIAAAIRDHQVVIVAGATGSGKTTQIPKICLELGRGIHGTIGHTQPRRIAARTVAERLSEELAVELGGVVGYQVRFTDQVSPTTLIKVMTDGILLAEIQRDPLLRRYDTIIVDEAHERSLNIDFLLGYLHQLLPQRPDLKVIVTSATIDSERFAEYFASAITPASAANLGHISANEREGPHSRQGRVPVIEVSGRTYPVEVRYRPLVPDLEDESATGTDTPDGGAPSPTPSPPVGAGHAEDAIDQSTGICLAADELMAAGPGDILVFCSGEREIRDATDALASHLGHRYVKAGMVRSSAHAPDAVEVVPLYARLSSAEQHRVFEKHTVRRIVIATNVAETSLTVPGIRYVIDTGTARISRYSNRTKVQRLPIEPVSQASANQRAGRCGRVADGICIRLYSRRDYDGRPEFTEPEILRTSLASVILQMAAAGLGEITRFDFLDPPDSRAIRDGTQLLHELGAMDTTGPETRLTTTGRQLAQLPIDPRMGRMIVEAAKQGCLREVMIIVAGLSVQDVRERPAEAQQAADEKHRRFADPTSDFLSILNLWRYLITQQRDLSSSAFHRQCKAEYLHFLRIREWQDVHSQLRQMVKHLGLPLGHERHDPSEQTKEQADARADAIHISLLAGLLSQIGSWDERRREYTGARGTKFVIFPGSHLAKKNPAWVMAGELVETSRLFARTVARIKPEWAEPLAEHLIKRVHAEPFWSSKQGAAMVKEKVLLYGLPIVAERPVPLARVDPHTAREMFIRRALVEGDWRSRHAFVAANAELLAEAESVAARERRHDLLIDDAGIYDFYDARIPAEVTTARHFDSWWKNTRRDSPDLLSFTMELLIPEQEGLDPDAFPDTWRQGDLTLPLSYQFEPGTESDGVTVHIPIAVLHQVRPDGFDWLVPGLIDELVVATIRALPKPLRRNLVPAPDVAREVVARLPPWAEVAPAPDGAPGFLEAFARCVAEMREVTVRADDVDTDRVPPHLRMTFQVHGERGAVMGTGNDLAQLQRRLARESADAVRSAVRGALSQARGPVPKDRGEQSGDGAPGGPAARVNAAELTPGLAEEAGLTDWPALDVIPASVTSTGPGGLEVRGYPALVDERVRDISGKSQQMSEKPRTRAVGLRVLTDAGNQAVAHRGGVRALLLHRLALATNRVTSRWSSAQSLALAASPYRSTDALVRDLQLAAIASLTAEADLAALRRREDFEQLVTRLRHGLEDEVHRLAVLAAEILTISRELDGCIKATTSMALLDVLTDVRDQQKALIHEGFLLTTPPDRLAHLPRYLRAAVVRLQKAAENPRRDADLAWQLSELQEAWWAAGRSAEGDPIRMARVDQVRWQLEELRVSFFAQQLGTSEPVSAKRLRKALAEV
ncbi:ATP-dependent RNA helicase HrpA [Ruania halotolerans]|uniref:ATP-dependent RNA helicase HrpA n=1 Tax=Ruania halotolerans TaxID=2897773 RepID=UPI001E4EA2C1|nr:ATP-dependent RNA helicase HrpA [Ruania halotolerans]UFU06827.1 ATP-dependent RNA helicase HrpA [Ruania halotolerans]